MKGKETVRILVLIAGVVFGGIISCGGGGGGGGGDSSAGLTYYGSTAAALITEDNAIFLANGALNTGDTGTSFTGLAALDDQGPVADDRARPFLVDLSQTLQRATIRMDFTTAMALDFTSALESDTGSISGPCGGSASYRLQVDTQTGDFSGRFNFKKYCDEGTTVNGPADFSGIIDVNTLDIESFTISFDYITASSGFDSLTMDGDIDYFFVDATVSFAMDMKIRDDTSGRVCKVENYQVNMTDMGTYFLSEIFGRFYDPDYGYVDLETTTLFRIDDHEEYPSSGIQFSQEQPVRPAGGRRPGSPRFPKFNAGLKRTRTVTVSTIIPLRIWTGLIYSSELKMGGSTFYRQGGDQTNSLKNCLKRPTLFNPRWSLHLKSPLEPEAHGKQKRID